MGEAAAETRSGRTRRRRESDHLRVLAFPQSQLVLPTGTSSLPPLLRTFRLEPHICMIPPSDYSGLAGLYRRGLLEDVIPFWERHSPDREYGGFFTCLNREGSVFDTDKFVWLQARQVWTFSMLYNQVEARPAWLALAKHGADFLRAH